MTSLGEELAKLANPTPLFHDPEDDVDDVTGAKVVEKSGDAVSDIVDDLQSSKLRSRAAVLLGDTDTKYAGRKVSRKSLKRTEEESSDDDIDPSAVDALEKMMVKSDDDDENDDDDLQSFKSKLSLSASKQKGGFSFEDDGDYSKYADDFDDDNDVDDDEEEEDDDESMEDDDNDDDIDIDEENEDVCDKPKHDVEEGIESFSKASLTEEVLKGKAARSQLALWDNLLEERIKVQKVASVINQLPQPDTWRMFVEKGGDNYVEAAKEAQGVLKRLLDDLLRVQTLLLLRNQETKHVVDGSDPKTDKADIPDSDNEEITSESETESTSEPKKPGKRSIDEQNYLKRKFKMADYPDFLSKRHKSFSQYRNETIHKWNDKTRLSSGKVKGKSFSALEQTAMKQIEQIMRDKERLIKRTQLNRSGQRVLGMKESVEDENQRHTDDQMPSAEVAPGNEYSGEVFDDTDFYHQLLRELIERKTSEIDDPIAISRQWLEIQKLRTKVKRKKVDTRASKGRKIRYDVHSKLVNFMAPMDNSPWTDESRNDLFKSLFGKKFKQDTTEQNASVER